MGPQATNNLAAAVWRLRFGDDRPFCPLFFHPSFVGHAEDHRIAAADLFVGELHVRTSELNRRH